VPFRSRITSLSATSQHKRWSPYARFRWYFIRSLGAPARWSRQLQRRLGRTGQLGQRERRRYLHYRQPVRLDNRWRTHYHCRR